jgi:hypothetical protein
MLERRNLETIARQAITARSGLSLNWYLDPATGKPVARWVREPAERTQVLAAAYSPVEQNDPLAVARVRRRVSGGKVAT